VANSWRWRPTTDGARRAGCAGPEVVGPSSCPSPTRLPAPICLATARRSGLCTACGRSRTGPFLRHARGRAANPVRMLPRLMGAPGVVRRLNCGARDSCTPITRSARTPAELPRRSYPGDIGLKGGTAMSTTDRLCLSSVDLADSGRCSSDSWGVTCPLRPPLGAEVGRARELRLPNALINTATAWQVARMVREPGQEVCLGRSARDSGPACDARSVQNCDERPSGWRHRQDYW